MLHYESNIQVITQDQDTAEIVGDDWISYKTAGYNWLLRMLKQHHNIACQIMPWLPFLPLTASSKYLQPMGLLFLNIVVSSNIRNLKSLPLQSTQGNTHDGYAEMAERTGSPHRVSYLYE